MFASDKKILEYVIVKKAHLVQATKRKCVGQDNCMKLSAVLGVQEWTAAIPLKG